VYAGGVSGTEGSRRLSRGMELLVRERHKSTEYKSRNSPTQTSVLEKYCYMFISGS